MDDAFASKVLSDVSTIVPSELRVFYNEDGDCIEVLFSDESFYAKRIDSLVTVYCGRDTDDIVGLLIKDIRSLLGEK